MSVVSLAAWALGRRSATQPPAAGHDRARFAKTAPLLGWPAAVAAAFATLAAVAGSKFWDRPTISGGLIIVVVVAIVALLSRRLASRILRQLSGAMAERDSLKAELDAAREANEEIRSLAYHDELTGLPNRSLLHDRLGQAIAQATRQGKQLGLLFLDLDDFKVVNDTLGHGSGDRALVEIARRIRASVRAADTVARLGGDEFIVVLADVAFAEDAARVADKVLAALRAPFRLEGREITIAASIGVSLFPGDGVSSEDLMRSADEAMYRDKHRESAPEMTGAR